MPAIIAAHGGRYLARGAARLALDGAALASWRVIRGFPDMARRRASCDTPEYRPPLALRLRAAQSTLTAIDGV